MEVKAIVQRCGVAALMWLLVIFIVAVVDAQAQCDCIGGTRENDYRASAYSSAIDEFNSADVVFVGRFLGQRTRSSLSADNAHPGDGQEEYQFLIEMAWKKNLAKRVSVRMLTPECIIRFEEGEKYLVYAYFRSDSLHVNYCSRTRLACDAQRDLLEFREHGEIPVPGSS